MDRKTLIARLTAIALSPDIGYPADEVDTENNVDIPESEINSQLMASVQGFLKGYEPIPSVAANTPIKQDNRQQSYQYN